MGARSTPRAHNLSTLSLAWASFPERKSLEILGRPNQERKPVSLEKKLGCGEGFALLHPELLYLYFILTFSQAYRPIRSGPLARKVLLPPWAARSRNPEGHSSPAPGPRLPWHTKARAGAPQLPGGFPRRNSSRWRRPLEGAGQSWPRRRPGAPGGEPSWDEPCGEQGREGAPKIPGAGGWEEEEANLRAPANFIGLKSFFCCRLPLACGAVPCVRCFWKVGSSHIPRRFSRHLTRGGGGGGGGRGRDADRHHPPRRTHSRTLPGHHSKAGSGRARARSERTRLPKGKPHGAAPFPAGWYKVF